MKLRVGDKVKVTAGKDKGREGVVNKVYPKEDYVRIQGLNVYKKHVKGFGGEKGGIVEFSRPLPVANVALICPNCGKTTRVRHRIDKTGEKARVCAKCNRIIKSDMEAKK